MTLRLKLTSVILIMILVIIAGLEFFTLTRASKLQKETTFQYADALSDASASEARRRIESFLGYGEMITLLLSDYENTAENLRRTKYNDILRSTIQKYEYIIGIFTAWIPGSIDSYDAELGQFQTFYSRRRNGTMEHIPEGYEGWQDYLKGMAKEGKTILESPVWRDVFGFGNVPIISVQYPIKSSEGKVVGVIGINFVGTMQEIVDELVRDVYDGRGAAGIYSNDGIIIAHNDRQRVKSNIRNHAAEIALLGDQRNRVVQAISGGGENGKPITIIRYSEVMGTDLYLIYHPIVFSGIGTTWYLMLGIPMDEITAPIRKTTLITIIFAVIILVVASIVTLFFAQSIVKPIRNVTLTLKGLSEGEGDLTRRITCGSKDEVGDLSRYFNQTLEKIKNLIIVIKNQAGMLSDTGHDLAGNMAETAAAINEITANIQSIKGRVINQSASVTETNAAMEQLTVNINRLDKHVENQSNNVSLASAAIEGMVANIQSVTESLVRNSANVMALKESSEEGRTGLQEVASNIREIARESEGLMEINSVMENIASQTNLLSMNAAIEAAHAGAAGKGFAVVADEIRKLAESSSAQSKTISTVLKKIKTSIDKITFSAGNVLNKFEAIDTSVRIVADQEDSIRSAMEEQREGSKQILDGIEEVTEITRQVKSGSGEMSEGTQEVIRESKNLEKATQEITGGMNEMASGADQINSAVHEVNDLCGRNQESIELLVQEVSRFKVD